MKTIDIVHEEIPEAWIAFAELSGAVKDRRLISDSTIRLALRKLIAVGLVERGGDSRRRQWRRAPELPEEFR